MGTALHQGRENTPRFPQNTAMDMFRSTIEKRLCDTFHKIVRNSIERGRLEIVTSKLNLDTELSPEFKERLVNYIQNLSCNKNHRYLPSKTVGRALYPHQILNGKKVRVGTYVNDLISTII